jgi:hypothetical protein
VFSDATHGQFKFHLKKKTEGSSSHSLRICAHTQLSVKAPSSSSNPPHGDPGSLQGPCPNSSLSSIPVTVRRNEMIMGVPRDSH